MVYVLLQMVFKYAVNEVFFLNFNEHFKFYVLVVMVV
jgi:hypothetical protein